MILSLVSVLHAKKKGVKQFDQEVKFEISISHGIGNGNAEHYVRER
jgi:hypothetical protein